MRSKGSTVKLDSSEVQGEGSFVELRRPNWKAMRGALAAFQEAGGETQASQAGLAMMDALLPGMITAWNWTDEDGKALPLPSADRTALDDLEPAEALWLVNQASGLVNVERKN